MHEPDVASDLLADMGYETRDVRLQPLIVALAGLAMLIMVSSLFCLWFYRFTSPKFVEEQALPKWITQRRLPPNPQVQAYPKDEIKVFYQAQDPKLAALEKAKADAVAEGIAGVTGGTEKEAFSADFPGSGKFGPKAAGEAEH